MVVLTDLKQHSQLYSLLSSATSLRRPLLTHLSADNSWLLSVPIPENGPAASSQDTKQRHRKVYFHLLLDAWLTPTNAPFPGALWFQVQHHVETPAYQSIAAVIDLIADIEAAASAGMNLVGGGKAEIDAVVVGQNLPDHMHYDTLKQVDATVPMLAAEAAVPTVQSWKHFETIVQIPEFGTNSGGLDWRTSSGTQVPPLPSWLAVWRIPGPKTTPALHWAVCIVFEVGGADQVQAECVGHSPHGLYVEDIAVLKSLSPGVKALALLHTTKESWFYWWKKANLGAGNGVQIAEAVGPRYWVSTHDELVNTTGINKWFLKDLPHDGVEVIRLEKDNGRLKELEFVQVGNGESLLLV